MTRPLLAAAALAPLILAAGAAEAQVSITTSTTTPIATATASSGAPANIDIAAGGSVGLTVPGVAVTINSSNSVTLEGEIGSTGINGSTGVQLIGGNTGAFTNSTGSILMTETYTASTDTKDGLLTGAFAQGSDRIGIQVAPGATFIGSITSTGGLTVNGNTSYGVDIEAPITGSLLFQTVSPTTFTSSTTVTVLNGSIAMLGDNSTGLYIAPAGGVGGSIQVGTISATGAASQGAVINGTVGGTVNFSGSVTSTGYRTTTRSSDPTLEALYTATELQQGGSPVVIGGVVQQGVIVSAPPLILSSTNPDLDSNGVPDSQQPRGTITSYGAAPAFVVGVAGQNGYLGAIPAGNGVQTAPGEPTAFGLVNQGEILGNGVFDPVTTPNIGGPISGTALQIGTGDATGTYTAQIAGGVYNTGTIEGEAYQANATAIHVIAGGQTPLILNDGSIYATSIQVTTTAAAGGYNPVNVYGILIDPGAKVSALTNNSAIIANITGTGGAGAAEVGAVIDRSGTLNTIVNTGSITAQATQTQLTQQMPVGGIVAIDVSASTAPQTLTQQINPNLPTAAAYNQTTTYTVGQYASYENVVYQALTSVATAQDPLDYPSLWRPVGAVSPSIAGDILFGSGGTTLNISAGTIVSPVINLGTGANTINIAGLGTATTPCSGISCVSVTGAIEEGSLTATGHSTFTLNLNNGTLTDTNPNLLTANAINVGANGLLIVAADPRNGTHTEFVTSGASSFAQGAQVGITLLSLPTSAQQVYTILQTTGAGTLSAGTFASNAVGNAPFLYYANASYVPAATAGGPAAIDLTVTQKTAAQLGFNTAEGNALTAVLDAAPQNAAIQNALLTQTTQAGLRSVYDQLLPNQGQGLFDALDAAEQSIASLTSTAPDNGKRQAGTSLWLQEVNEQVSRSGIDSPGGYAKLVGLVAGWEHLGVAGGAVGATLSYMNISDVPTAAELGSSLVAQLFEASLYYRRTLGDFTFAARAGIGVAFETDDRVFLAPGTRLDARSNFNALFYEGHVALAYERHLGRFYVRPEISADYLALRDSGYSETGGGSAFDLSVDPQTDTRLTGSAILAVGREWGKDAWVRSEFRFGVREVLEGQVGDTEAAFAGGPLFAMTPDNDEGGWGTIGFSLKAGSPTSYFALEGDADFRNGEQRYNVRIAGRSLF
jgi:hypothetical protein